MTKAGIQFPAEHLSFVIGLSDESVATRYPEDLKAYDKKRAKECLEKTRQVTEWLEHKLKSAE